MSCSATVNLVRTSAAPTSESTRSVGRSSGLASIRICSLIISTAADAVPPMASNSSGSQSSSRSPIVLRPSYCDNMLCSVEHDQNMSSSCSLVDTFEGTVIKVALPLFFPRPIFRGFLVGAARYLQGSTRCAPPPALSAPAAILRNDEVVHGVEVIVRVAPLQIWRPQQQNTAEAPREIIGSLLLFGDYLRDRDRIQNPHLVRFRIRVGGVGEHVVLYAAAGRG
mmetsp:Transcript_11088/g.28416  ORF Transcript_11088/g.28416 Transcript_11088/m.28416 type:complete len:224 (+) Transcript_11088:302-973(+)